METAAAITPMRSSVSVELGPARTGSGAALALGTGARGWTENVGGCHSTGEAGATGAGTVAGGTETVGADTVGADTVGAGTVGAGSVGPDTVDADTDCTVNAGAAAGASGGCTGRTTDAGTALPGRSGSVVRPSITGGPVGSVRS